MSRNKWSGARRSWFFMRARCNYQTCADYANYGGRGINVCERWLVFENFLEDMGERPPGMTLGRIDSDKDYCKENCSWQTKQDQNKNKSDTTWIIFDGVRMPITEASKKSGVSYYKLRHRVRVGIAPPMLFERGSLLNKTKSAVKQVKEGK